MSAHKHTPGPWSVLQEYVGGVLLGFGVASIADLLSTGSWYAISCSVKPNDARLIAAAPDLLAALEPFAHATLTHTGQVIGLTREDFERALAAIAKATGEPA